MSLGVETSGGGVGAQTRRVTVEEETPRLCFTRRVDPFLVTEPGGTVYFQV